MPSETETDIKKVKSGWKTTEFFMTIVANVSAILMAIGGQLDGTAAAIILGIANAGYAISRAHAKK